MAASAARRNEDHAGGTDRGHVLSGVAGALEDAAMAAADLARGRFHGAHDVVVERRPRHTPVVLELVRDALALRRVLHDPIEPTDAPIYVGIVGVAHVDR